MKSFKKQVGGEHYAKMAIQPAEYIHRNGIGFMEGAAIKYLSRWRTKGGLEDLRKAAHMIELLLEMEESTTAPCRTTGYITPTVSSVNTLNKRYDLENDIARSMWEAEGRN